MTDHVAKFRYLLCVIIREGSFAHLCAGVGWGYLDMNKKDYLVLDAISGKNSLKGLDEH